MNNSNDDFQDYLLKRQINLLRYSRSIQNKFLKIFSVSDSELKSFLLKEIDAIVGKDITSKVTRATLNNLDNKLKEFRKKYYSEFKTEIKSELSELSSDEMDKYLSNYQKVVPVLLEFNKLEKVRLNAIVNNHPFEGRVLKDWLNKLEADDVSRISSSVKLGLVRGDTTDQIVRNILNGPVNLSKNHIKSITRTAVMDVASKVRQDLSILNSDVFKKEIYTATLDGKTSAICKALDGKIFEIGQGKFPPLHFGCRSLRVPIISDKLIGDRPLKPVTEKILLREYTEKNGLKKVSQRNKLPRGFKADFDKFSRKRTRELIGTTPAQTNYEDFLRRQSKEFQDETLGKGKAKLFREQKLSLSSFIDKNGNELTLKELKQKYEK